MSCAISSTKRSITVRTKPAKAKTRAKKTRKYGHYASYKEYSEAIIAKPMRQLFGLLKNKGGKAY